MTSIEKNKIIFVGGKGGVGKSTTAAALALSYTSRGYRTLVVSTDPAHNLGDIFHKQLENSKKPLMDGLWGLEIDPGKEAKRYIQGVKNNLKGLVHAKMIEEVHRQIDLASSTPGAEEAALFDKLISIMIEEKDFDKIIFDTAPTGHTIRLLTLPEMMTVWVDGLLERRKKVNDTYTQLLHDGEPVEDPIYEVLQERREKFAKARGIILDEDKTGFLFVLNPERLPILETKQAVRQLDTYDIRVHTLVVNKVLPPYADGSFLERRRKQEQMYMQDIGEIFKEQRLLKIPLFTEDIADLDQLQAFSRQFDQENLSV
ncbi:ArsA family ATPase [Halobacillus sp. ACCC02827]|uniref:ArsA family ATPase n=1 Tax=Halobacillus sp. ACCC02827 TaxID=3052090 RepID=UPI002570EEC7|nr:ArsA family ATPase [Halobacillus sp. ACCC02827]WJE14943.1 ArsA family ATPase [Halobacillus sp. ACCC02827]